MYYTSGINSLQKQCTEIAEDKSSIILAVFLSKFSNILPLKKNIHKFILESNVIFNNSKQTKALDEETN